MSIGEKELYEIVVDIECNSTVNDWVYEGIEIWPLIRCSLRDAFLVNQRRLASKGQKKHSVKFDLHAILQSFKTYRSVPKTDLLIFTSTSGHSDHKEEKPYDRVADPVYEFLADYIDWSVTKISNGKKPPEADGFFPMNFMDLRLFANPVKYIRHQRGAKKYLDSIGVVEEIERRSGLIFKSLLIKSISFILAAHKSARSILKRSQPRAVALVCYYHNVNFAYINAAKSLGIPTVDIQHGKQGIYHLMYTHWSQIPEGGYRMLPDFFWNWGENSKINIQKGRNSLDYHQPIALGNHWLINWKKTRDIKPSLTYEKLLDAYSTIVLFSLQQDMENPIPDFVLKVIEETQHSVLWLFRLHPAQKIGNAKVREMLGNLKVNNIEIKESSALPLYQIIEHIDIHLTNWSSVCIEALGFGVKSIIVHANGYDLYEELIKVEQFFFANDSNSLQSAMDKILADTGEVDASTHFLMDMEIIKERTTQLFIHRILSEK